VYAATIPAEAPVQNSSVTFLLSFKMGEYDRDMIEILKKLGGWDEETKGGRRW
jgi:hypothetical protein